MDLETIRIVFAVLLTVLLYVGIPTTVFFWLMRNPEWWTGKYPEWIYGMETRLRLYVKRAFVVNMLMVSALGILMQTGPPTLTRFALAGLVLLPIGVVTFRHLGARRRAFERSADEGVEVVARIRSDRQRTLGHPRYVGGSEIVAHAAIGFGAALIWKGQWTMEIEFDLDGRTIIDRRQVSSQAYYRFAGGDTMPILVRADDPKAWIPILGELPRRASLAEAPSAASA